MQVRSRISYTPRPVGTPLDRGDYRGAGLGPLDQEGWRKAPGCVARAFSLIEVIIAVALFAASVTVILALLPGLTRRSAENADRLVAQRLPDAVRVELERLALPGFDALAAQAPVMGTPPENGLALVATRDGARVQARDAQAPATGRIADGEQYFLVECWRFADGPLRYDAAQSSLALCVRVTWPYRLPGSTTSVTETARQEFTFVTTLNR